MDRLSQETKELENDEKTSQLKNCTDIKAIPGYHIDNFPYLITRTLISINLIDLKRTKAYPLLYEKKPDFDNEFLNVFLDQHDNIGIVYAVMTKDSKHDAIKSV